MAGALLETYLKRVVEGFRLEQRQPFKVAVELRIWPQQIDERDLVIVIQRVGFVKDCIRPAEQGLKGIVYRVVKLIVEILRVVLLANGRGNVVSIARGHSATAYSASPAPGQVRAVIGGVISRDHDLSGQQPLHTETPLINIGVLRLRGT